MAAVPSARCNKGFTLIELMVVVIVLAIASAIALPNFAILIRSNRVATQANELLGSIALARTEAIRANVSPVGNRDVVLCPSTNGTSCSAGWSSGWIVARRVDDAIVTVLRHTQQPTGVTITGAATEIVFDNRGRRVSGPNTLTVTAANCKPGENLVRTLTLNASGQVRIAVSNCT
jgi:type IV fimbrial biogenesis protein FimT